LSEFEGILPWHVYDGYSANNEFMRKIILLTCMLSISLIALADKIGAKSLVHVMSNRMDVFYFKVDKELLGAELEIYSQNGIKLFTQKISHRKVLIDFYFENPGNFIIMVRKGDTLEEFNFTKTDPCIETDKPTELITVIQGI
jgi:hypothetical protein